MGFKTSRVLICCLILFFGFKVFAGDVWIVTKPGEVNIKLDGIDIGKTQSDGTFNIKIPEGKHKFKFEKKGYKSVEKEVIIKAKNPPIKVELVSLAELKKKEEEKKKKEEAKKKKEQEKKEYGGLKIETNVKAAAIYIDGKYRGLATRTPPYIFALEKIKKGKHTIEIKGSGEKYLPLKTEINIKPQTLNEFKLKLKLNPKYKKMAQEKSFFKTKKGLFVLIAGGGLLLIIISIILMLVSSRKKGYAAQVSGQTGGVISTSPGTTGAGTSSSVGIFNTPAGAESDLNQLLQGGNIDVLIGKTVLGDYYIEGKIGEGGMGAILLATQKTLDRKTALKIILPKYASNENVVKRFFREVKLTSKLTHPNIVTIYNFGKSKEGMLFVAMEFLDGINLDALIRENPEGIGIKRSVLITAQIASALNEAHSKGIIHRDLKPSNIMIIERGGIKEFVKVLDFGIAKSIEDQGSDEPTLTMSGQILGTPAYMSPEQCSGKKLDNRTDLYSLGVMTFEMLTGRKPFIAETTIGYIQAHLMTPPPKLSQFMRNQKVPPKADQVMLKILAKKREERYSSAIEFAKDLAAAFEVEVNIAGF